MASLQGYFVLNEAEVARLFKSEDGPTGKFIAKTAVKVETKAKRLCPVDTGRLRSSITHEVGMLGKTVIARVGTNVDYAVHVEFGTRRMRAQPFLRPALRAI